MSEKGHILLHRQLLDSEIFSNKTGLKIWVWLLFKASYKTRFVPLKIGKGETTVKLERGQLLFGRFKAEEALNIDGSTIYKWIHKMQDSGMVTIESNSHSSIITIANYDTYQMSEKEKEQPINSQVTANQQPSNNRVTHISNVNKDNKDKKDKEDIPSLQDLRDGFINFATDYFKESNEGYDYNRLKLEADEFAHYWLDAKKGCKTQWEKKKRSDIKATARSRFTDRLGKIKTYGTEQTVNYDPPKPEKIKTPEEIAWEKEQSAKLKKKTEELKAKIKADQERDKNDKPEYKQVPREESLALLNRLGE